MTATWAKISEESGQRGIKKENASRKKNLGYYEYLGRRKKRKRSA